jgi:hypothetical protein
MINLSQQLCNVCGVKPEIIQDYELNDIEIYPDFEDNNNNFIKLFELSLPKICGVKFTISQLLCESVEFKFADKRTFLIQLINFINICKYFGRYVKQTIRKTNWEY